MMSAVRSSRLLEALTLETIEEKSHRNIESVSISSSSEETRKNNQKFILLHHFNIYISPFFSIVISMGEGREEENGRIAPMPDMKVGDYVIAKNPWGIGPKDEETNDGKKLSFMRSGDIAAVLDGDFLGEEE